MKKGILINLSISFFTLIVCLFLSEYIFRAIIFGNSEKFKYLRDPGKFSSWYESDYWKLYYLFDGTYKPVSNTHPILGWGAYFNNQTYLHRDTDKIKGRNRVLLYGDSFAQCVRGSVCFEELLNNDTVFNRENYLLNYGVGGYGVDQIYLLCSLSVSLHENPIVFISILPTDMDRSLLSVRVGQKPYFEIENDKLILKGVPIYEDPEKYFTEDPPSIKSYLYARYKHSNLNKHYDPVNMPDDVKEKMKNINNKIILELSELLKRQNIRYVFIIFDNVYNEDGDWRYKHLMKFMADNDLPYFGTLDLIDLDTSFEQYDFYNYFLKEDGHPSTHYNQLVANEIKKFTFNYDSMVVAKKAFYKEISDTNSIASVIYRIYQDKNWYKDVKLKSIERNIPLDSMMVLDAKWVLEHK